MTATAALGLLGPGAGTLARPVLVPERNTEWFANVYEVTVDSLYRYAFTLTHDANRAEDLAADAYLNAWRNRSSLRADSTVLPWLMSIAHNLAISQFRSAREVADLSVIAEPEDSLADPATATFAESDAAAVHKALLQLTAEQQQVVFLRFFEGLPHDAVATRLGRNANAIRAIQFRALARLRKLLEESHAV
jgi:RNA polymerase sigma-70 factor, ECF subfamily